jgi:DNA-binding MarR family transcriptional regulator
MSRIQHMPERSLVALDKAFELADRLGALSNRALAARDLTPSQAHVIFVLAQQGPIVQRELSDALGCTPRHVTTLVDALESRGLVAREAHPTDRRALLVALTAQGETEAARFDAERAQASAALLGDAPREQLDGFIATAEQLLARIEEFTDGVAPTAPDQERRHVAQR